MTASFILMFRFPTVCILLLLVVFPAASQDSAEKVSVPDAAMKNVVSRILKWEFKPRKSQTRIYLGSKGLKKDWLPKIKNIEFIVLSPNNNGYYDRRLYFFKDPVIDGNRYRIDFGFGVPNCSADGDIWYFRIFNSRVNLVYANDRWIEHCSVNDNSGPTARN